MLSILEVPVVRRQAVPISVATYQAMGAQGLVDSRTELLRGLIIEKMSRSPLHASVVRKLFKLLAAVLQSGQVILKEDPLTFADSEPEPDLAVVTGREEDFDGVHPHSAQLVIEVAISTEGVDREKAGVYSEANVAEYWLVLPETGTIEVFTQPEGAAYLQKRIVHRGEILASVALPKLRVELGKLFG